MASNSRKSRLVKDNKNEDPPSTDSPKNMAPHLKALDRIYEDQVVTPKKPKGNKIKSVRYNMKDYEISKDLESSDEESHITLSKNNKDGKKKNIYECSLVHDDQTIKMKIKLTKSAEFDCIIGAKERPKANNRSSETPRKARSTVGNVNYHEDALMIKHEMDCRKKMGLDDSVRGNKNNKSQAFKNIAESSPRKRLNQNSQEQDKEGYGIDENEMSHANQILSPPKRSKSETEMDQTPKKKSDLIDIKGTPRSAAKRKLDLPTEPVNSRVNTRKSTAENSAVNYKDWSSSDDNMTKTNRELKVVLNKDSVDKSIKKRANTRHSKNVGVHDTAHSEIKDQVPTNRNTTSRSKSLQVSVKAKDLKEPDSPSKAMENLNLNNDGKTPRSPDRLILKLKKTSESTPNKFKSNADQQEGIRKMSLRNAKTRYHIPRYSDDESQDSSDNYEGEECSDSEEESQSSGDESAEEFQAFNRRKKIQKTPRKNAATPKVNRRVIKVSMDTPTKAISRMSLGTPSLDKHRRTSSIIKPSTPLQEARAKLHVSVLPKSLPCREAQFNDIYSFLHARLSDGSGGCIYISGVPGTGKTATVTEVICCLKKSVIKGELPEFDYIDINGMKLSEPRQAYVQIWKQMSGETKSWEESHKLLQNKFNNSNSKRRMTLLLVDELDLICTKRQDVVYNLLDWPSKTNAKLVVVTIANTMDLPERILMGKVTSRLGLTRLTFPPYNFKQLEEIVISRMRGFNAFGGETVQLIARKVAAVSGDARRALDICRRSTEIAEQNKRELVSMIDVKQALDEMIASPKIQAIKHCSEMEKFFLQAVCAEVYRTGIEEVIFKDVYIQMESLCSIDGKKAPNTSVTLEICARLGSYRLLLCDHSRMDIHQRLLLNVSTDDVHFATRNISA